MQSSGTFVGWQGPLLHSASSSREPSHALPVPTRSVTMWRVRLRWPMPQSPVLALHLLHGLQSLTTQSTGSNTTLSHFSAPTLQSSIIFSGPLHNFPPPEPCTAMLRDLSFHPSQLQLQPLHSVHSPNSQSLGREHDPTLQDSYSWDTPTTGSPHSLAWRSILRLRQRTPPSQVAVHFSHSDQPAHLPSTQALQLCVLHAPTSRLDHASHNLPFPRGAVVM
mmetsp:Transcript_40246/g.110693  ORF Transcript_40246/g.110693 Transcript_40246/m.110693 type:complete len:221 (-) Transcript_40246:2795-3457(-)